MSWIHETIGPRMAYYAGWTYWVVHMPYISQKPGSTVIAASWALFQDKRDSNMNTTVLHLICLVVFLFAMYLSGKGMSKLFLKNEHSSYEHGRKLVLAIVSVLIVVPAFGIRNVDVLVGL